MILLCIAMGAWAQFVTIGKGDSSSSYLPTKTNYNYSFTEQIYTGAEIGVSGKITSLGFYNTESNDVTRTVDIFMMPTSKSTFGSDYVWMAMSEEAKVFSGEVTFKGKSWTQITLSKPLEYDNTQNLLLAVNDRTGSYESGVDFAVFYGSSGYKSLYAYNDYEGAYNPYSPGTPYNRSDTSYKNIIRLGCELDCSAFDNEGNYLSDIDFGTQSNAVTKTFTVKNNTESLIQVDLSLSCFPDNLFSIDKQHFSIAGGATETITVTMNKEPYGIKNGNVIVSFGDTKQEITLTGTILPPDVAIDEEHFPDEKFRSLVKYRHDKNSDNILSGEEILAVKELDFYMGYQYPINDLTGMEYFIEMESFNNGYPYSFFGFEELDLSNFLKLKYFRSQNTNLKVLKLPDNGQMVGIDCYDNKLTSLDVSNYPELKELYCSNNQLTSLDVSANQKLENLQCNGNQITSLNIANNQVIKYLYIYNNPLESITFGNNTSLELLDVSECNLKTWVIDKENVPNLQAVIISKDFIRGKAMDDLISSLPAYSGKEDWYKAWIILNKDYVTQDKLYNVVTEAQRDAAAAKNWNIGFSNVGGYNIMNPAPNGIVLADENFPDENLQNALFHTSIGTDGVITPEEQAATTSLELSEREISNPKGLEVFTALQSLSIYNNSIQGENMDALVEALPIRSENDGELKISTQNFTWEHNTVTRQQVDAMKAKGWNVLVYDDYKGWIPYIGTRLPVYFYNFNTYQSTYFYAEADVDINAMLKEDEAFKAGTVSYDNTTRTITFDGMEYDGYLFIKDYSGQSYSFNVIGENNIKGGMRIYTENATFNGGGSLHIGAMRSQTYYPGDIQITIDGPTIEIKADDTNASFLYCEAFGNATLSVLSGRLSVTGEIPFIIEATGEPCLELGDGISILEPEGVEWKVFTNFGNWEGYEWSLGTFVDSSDSYELNTTIVIGALPNAISTIDTRQQNDGEYYTIDGRKLGSAPTQKGIYIFNGRKVAVK